MDQLMIGYGVSGGNSVSAPPPPAGGAVLMPKSGDKLTLADKQRLAAELDNGAMPQQQRKSTPQTSAMSTATTIDSLFSLQAVPPTR